MKWISELNTDCQVLWKSRIIAGYDLFEAKKIMEEDAECNRNEYYYQWRAQLEWLLGNQQNAAYYWKYLSVPQLWEQGKSDIYNGNIDRALVVFELIMKHPDLGLRKADKTAFFADLGDLYRQKGDWEKAAQYYSVAWVLDGKSYIYSYLLGNAYWNLKKCQEAIPVFEAGLQNRSDPYHTDTEYFYHAFLGNCYASMGNRDAARENYLIARQILKINKDLLPQEFIESQSRWLKSLQSAINADMEP
jgi:tetratricopeptide (TPR) repeat protein